MGLSQVEITGLMLSGRSAGPTDSSSDVDTAAEPSPITAGLRMNLGWQATPEIYLEGQHKGATKREGYITGVRWACGHWEQVRGWERAGGAGNRRGCQARVPGTGGGCANGHGCWERLLRVTVAGYHAKSITCVKGARRRADRIDGGRPGGAPCESCPGARGEYTWGSVLGCTILALTTLKGLRIISNTTLCGDASHLVDIDFQSFVSDSGGSSVVKEVTVGGGGGDDIFLRALFACERGRGRAGEGGNSQSRTPQPPARPFLNASNSNAGPTVTVYRCRNGNGRRAAYLWRKATALHGIPTTAMALQTGKEGRKEGRKELHGTVPLRNAGDLLS
ncbi:hypothetical protein C8F01DRAFT_1079894 [Mycena amicta]|nr:hypothetical protein C8F01DRAFT_1079894 [Mycena amicta]